MAPSPSLRPTPRFVSGIALAAIVLLYLVWSRSFSRSHSRSPIRPPLRDMADQADSDGSTWQTDPFTNSVFKVGEYWNGLESLTQLVIFGDSYSDVGWRTWAADPSAEEPLGIKWPGGENIHWIRPFEQNWVTYLLENDGPSARPIVYDFAKGGVDVNDLFQDLQAFKNILSQGVFSIKSDTSLFVLWIGINDVCNARYDFVERVGRLNSILSAWYRSGARNFLIIDVPPRLRPALRSGESRPKQYVHHHERIATWNTEICKLASSFADESEHKDATVLLFSAHHLFDRMLSKPTGFGFAEEDPGSAHGAIWADGLHPRTAVHKILADEIARFLRGVQRAV